MSLKNPLGGNMKVESMTQLRDFLLLVINEMRADAVPLGKVKEYANVAGKVIKSASVQVEYSVARKEKPEIPFLK